MRILFVAKHLSPGGIAVQMRELGQLLVKRGHEVALVSRGLVGEHPRDEAAFEAIGIPHHRVDFPSPLLSGRGAVDACRAVRQMSRVAAEVEPDLLHVHWRITTPYAQWLRRRMGLPYMTTWHNLQLRDNLLNRWLVSPGDRAVAVSEVMREFLVQGMRFPEAKTRTIPNAVDGAYFSPPTAQQRQESRSRWGLSEADFGVCMAANLIPCKRHDLAVRAVASLHETGRAAHLLLAGAGPTEQQVRSLADELGVGPYVHLIGYADPRSIFHASDVQVCPSDLEAYSLAVVEGMLCRVPIVRTPSGGTHEQIVEGVTGLLMDFDDADGLAAHLKTLHDNPEQRRAMGEAARDHALHHLDPEAMASAYEAVYAEVIGQGRPSFARDSRSQTPASS